ncbi:MAG TPA: efflux RND transporter periplasmic adaptor subunit, partial [Psychromonas sp.]
MRYLLVLIFGLLLGFFATTNEQISSLFRATEKTVEPEILYWVAPMDANYRRDKPGKSPMGMDLVPVYEEVSGESEAGLVTISPAVENNLGVRTASVIKDDFQITIKSLGTVQANDDAVWQINSRVSGWIETLYVKSVGAEVKKGQPLFELYSPELVKAQESLFNALKLGRGALIISSKARLQALGVSAGQIDQIIKQGKVRQNITVYAPQKGTIAALNINEGAFISPAMQVIKAVNLDTVWVDVEIFAAQVSLVKLGDKATMVLDYFPGKTWQGQVDFIYPEMNPSNRTLRVRLQFANPSAQLKPNMFANILLAPVINKSTLQIPREAVIYAGNMKRVVLALGKGKFKSVAIQTGLENKDSVEVLSGVSEGQKIVTSAQFLLDSESSISADFERMLEIEKNKPVQPEANPSSKDDDLDWLDLGSDSDLVSPRKANLGLVAEEVI